MDRATTERGLGFHSSSDRLKLEWCGMSSHQLIQGLFGKVMEDGLCSDERTNGIIASYQVEELNGAEAILVEGEEGKVIENAVIPGGIQRSLCIDLATWHDIGRCNPETVAHLMVAKDRLSFLSLRLRFVLSGTPFLFRGEQATNANHFWEQRPKPFPADSWRKSL